MTQPPDSRTTAIIMVDHGSRRAESNDMLLDVVAMFRRQKEHAIVEPAHMELAEPSIATAFDRCVQQGATRVVVSPYFLLPGRHWDKDIPQLTADAAAKHPGVAYMVTAPIGVHPMMADVVDARIKHCLAHVAGEADECDVCAGTGRCAMYVAD